MAFRRFSALLLLACAATLPASARPTLHPDIVFPASQNQLSWDEAYALARSAASRLSFLQKQSLTTGTGLTLGPCSGNLAASIPSINLPRLCLQDGPVGLRGVDLVTVYPAGVTAAATWDRELMYLRSRAMGVENRLKGVNVALAPSAGALGRAPAAGRNWEGFGPDPYLAGIGAAASVRGLQDEGVIACVKHWLANEQERYRLVIETLLSATTPPITHSLSSEVGDRASKELYEWPFVDAIHAGAGGVMCAYQRVNGTYSCESTELIRKRLKGKTELKGGLGFRGFVVTDWSAAAGPAPAATAGIDMVMPGDAGLVALAAGALPASDGAGIPGESRLDEMAIRVLAAWYKSGQNKPGYPQPNFSTWYKSDYGAFPDRGYIGIINHHVPANPPLHSLVAKRIAEDGIVLLKNANAGNKGLPLKAGLYNKIGVFGGDAGPIPGGPNSCGQFHYCSAGTATVGSGSGAGTFVYLIDPLQAITEQATLTGATVTSNLDDYAYSAISSAAATQDACLVFINSRSGEGLQNVEGNVGDRNNLTAWRDGDTLVKTVANSCSNTIVVIHSVGPILMEAWIDHPNITSVLLANLPGQESGNSLVSVLWGAVNPSGKLPYTIARREADYCCRVQSAWTGFAPVQEFSEGGLIDYMWFEKNGKDPRFPFGFGLSYTQFAPVAGSLQVAYVTANAVGAGFHEEIVKLTFKVRNAGPIFGKVVVQLYVRFPSSVSNLPESPLRVLRGFDKVGLAPGEVGELEFSLRRRDLSWWDVVAQEWKMVLAEEYRFFVGESLNQIWAETVLSFPQ